MIRGGFWGGAWGLSWGGAWGEAWFLLNQPYQELSLKGQIFVRSYLTSIHSAEVVEQIVSVAALNNISVIDAEVVVAAKQTVAPVDVRERKCGANQVRNSSTIIAKSSTTIVAAVHTSEESYATIPTTRRELFVSQSSDEVRSKRAAA